MAQDLIRAAVSKKKTRFRDQGFDLDLTYITKNVIAMGFPSSGTEAMYRNPLPEVLKFFSFYHPNQFKVYNLCIEKQYPANTFPLQAWYPHHDHNPPPFKTLVEFCADARNYFDQNPSAVIAVHCKAGKGRTGTAIASYLCMKECATAEEALNIFGKARTSNNKGVTIPSQHRLVMYYAHYVKEYLHPGIPFSLDNYPQVVLKGFVLTHCPHANDGGCVPYFKIFVHGEKKPRYNMHKHQKLIPWKKTETQRREFRFSSEEGFPISGDFRIAFFDKESIGRTKLFGLWLNTAFFKKESYIFSKQSLDGPQKDTKNKNFHPDFTLELLLFPFPGSAGGAEAGGGQDANNTPFVPESVAAQQQEESSDDDEDEDEEEEAKKRTNSVLEGYLNVRTKGKAYRRSHMALFPSEMSFYDSATTKRPKDTILLTSTAKMGFIADSETEFWVCSSTDGRVYDLQTKSLAMRRTWMEAIASSILEIQKTQQHHSRSPSAHRRAIYDSPGGEGDRSERKLQQHSHHQLQHSSPTKFSFVDSGDTDHSSSGRHSSSTMTPHSTPHSMTPHSLPATLAPPSPPRMPTSPHTPTSSTSASSSFTSSISHSPRSSVSPSPAPAVPSSLAQLRVLVQLRQQALAKAASEGQLGAAFAAAEEPNGEDLNIAVATPGSPHNTTVNNRASTTLATATETTTTEETTTAETTTAETTTAETTTTETTTSEATTTPPTTPTKKTPPASPTSLDLQVMERLKQIQKLLDQQNAAAQTAL